MDGPIGTSGAAGASPVGESGGSDIATAFAKSLMPHSMLTMGAASKSCGRLRAHQAKANRVLRWTAALCPTAQQAVLTCVCLPYAALQAAPTCIMDCINSMKAKQLLWHTGAACTQSFGASGAMSAGFKEAVVQSAVCTVVPCCTCQPVARERGEEPGEHENGGKAKHQQSQIIATDLQVQSASEVHATAILTNCDLHRPAAPANQVDAMTMTLHTEPLKRLPECGAIEGLQRWAVVLLRGLHGTFTPRAHRRAWAVLSVAPPPGDYGAPGKSPGAAPRAEAGTVSLPLRPGTH